MGLLQKACQTYDCMAHLAGVRQENKETLAPVSHSITRAQIEITLDQDGNFLSARAVDKNEPKIIIPVTPESAGRTSAPSAHPLCEQLEYLAPDNEKKHSLYVKGLTDWANSNFSHPKLHAVLRYVQSGTIVSDLMASDIIETAKGNEKLLVRWVVNGLGEEMSGPCWTDRKLMQCFIDYYAAQQGAQSDQFCMILGDYKPSAEQHPKGIVPINGNAKLISANDSVGFTHLGRFDAPWQTATISYDASQKAHNALRWLVANQSVNFGGRTFLCWNPEGKYVTPPHASLRRRRETPQQKVTFVEYHKELQEALSGWKNRLPKEAGVVIAAFDAATTGRLAVTYYNELLASDFLDRLFHWEDTCCWEKGILGVQSPSLFSLINWAFGVPRDGKPEADPRILGQQMQRLIACRVDKEETQFPLDIERALVEKASNLLLYEDSEKKYYRRELLFVTCAAIRKYRYDHFKEEWKMALDVNNPDRSYLFGRLLAIAEAVEQSAYSSDETRETNALRMQKAFALRPMACWRILTEKLEPYYRQLPVGLRLYYRKQTQEIMDKLSPDDKDLNKKLDDVYLLGYYHQRAYRPEKKENTEE